MRKCLTFFISIEKSRNLGFEVNVIHSSSGNLDNINMGTFRGIGTPVDRGTEERDTGGDVLYELEFGDLPIFKDIAFCPVTKPSIGNMLLVGMEFF